MVVMKQILIIFIFSISTIASSKTFEIVTSDYPPYQMQDGDKVVGMTTEIVNEILKIAGHTGNFTLYPWARAYQMASSKPDVLIYSIARTPEREKLFKWIGPLTPYNIYLWKLSSRSDIKITKIEDAKRYMIGGVFDDAKAAQLQKMGFIVGKNIEMVRNDDLNIRKIFENHLDLIPFDEFNLPYKVRNSGYDVKKLTKLIKILTADLYLAASPATSDQTVEELRVALKSFQKSERYKLLREKYTK
jgi:polar amino acid transport system substrate-binding protein